MVRHTIHVPKTDPNIPLILKPNKKLPTNILSFTLNLYNNILILNNLSHNIVKE